MVDDSQPPAPFHCARCGNCCRWPGYVRLTAAEVDAIAENLGMSPADFTRLYTQLDGDRRGLALTESVDGSCIFLDSGNVCRIQSVKPEQCRGFPTAWNSGVYMAQCAGWMAEPCGTERPPG